MTNAPEFNIPTNVAEALDIFRAMRNVIVKNPGGADLRVAEVVATIGNNHFFYTKAYCSWAQEDGMWIGMDFTKGTPFWLEEMSTGKMYPIVDLSVGAEQLMKAINTVQ